jgi:hypothetical protein
VDNSFEQFGFTIELTKDLSPTLRLNEAAYLNESMHHSGGAATETTYIYKNPIRQAMRISRQFAPFKPMHTVVVGLGLGYIEISWAQILEELQMNPGPGLSLDSFESVVGLKSSFQNWVCNLNPNKVYSDIANSLSQFSSESAVKKILNENLGQNGNLFGDILLAPVTSKKWNMICYDAFSKKVSQPLWDEAFLKKFLTEHAADDCVFTTYASTSTLKKVLSEEKFTLLNRPGFSGKRESTLAIRGFFKDDSSLFQTF